VVFFFLQKKTNKKKVKLDYLLNFLQNAFFLNFATSTKSSSAVIFSYPFTKKK